VLLDHGALFGSSQPGVENVFFLGGEKVRISLTLRRANLSASDHTPASEPMKSALAAGFVTVAFGLNIQAPCLAQESKPEYAIKEDAPRTGSLIRRNAIEFKNVALNKRYAELSAQDRENLHSWWESLSDGDEPPFPEKGLKHIHDAVFKAQGKLMVEGDLFLIASVDPTGDVVEVKTIGSPSPEMTKFAASVVLLTKFKPGLCAGAPCRMDFPIRYRFVTRQ
jgi:hypothetical protein